MHIKKSQIGKVILGTGKQMKRLLLPLLAAIALPTAVNAFPHYPFRNNSEIIKNSDIILKTDSGEKYVVKETSIKVIKFGLDEGYERVSRNIDYYKKALKKCINHPFSPLSLETCSGIYDRPEDKTRISSLKNDLEAETESIHFIGVKFRDILIDLDLIKEGKFYDRVGCLNPKLKEKTILFWDHYYQIRRFKGQKDRSEYFNAPDEKSINAYEQVKVKLCERYAKF